MKIAIIGGGASGFFAAIRSAELIKENNFQGEVHIYESAAHYLQKVKISGGGRCNVTHHQFNPNEFVQNYPRGKKELKSPLSQFQAQDTVEWFEKRGVKLKVEDDGRMFPVTNKSDTIINCFMKQAQSLGVHIHVRSKVIQVDKHDKFKLTFKDSTSLDFDKILIATGSSKDGYAFAKNLGHTITELAPSLFSFKIKHPLLNELAGTSFNNTMLKLSIIGEKKFSGEGPILITHWGLSGPAILRMSAWAARELKRSAYQGTLTVNWCSADKISDIRNEIETIIKDNSQTNIKNSNPNYFTKRFWNNFLNVLHIDGDKRWSETSKKDINKIIENIYSMPLDIQGQNRFKDEFVECGGVNLKEIDFKTMESKLTQGLYFAGEVLDIDGITGGFNFQNAWTTGYIAGTNLVRKTE